jgi:hypothetical protein
LAAIAGIIGGTPRQRIPAKFSMISTNEASLVMKTLLLAVMLVSLVPIASYCQENDCFAFIENGAIVLTCGSEVVRSEDLGIQGFAISEDGQLGLKRSTAGPIVNGGTELINNSLVVNLSNEAVRSFDFYPDDFAATCGALLAEAPLRKGIVNVSSGESVKRGQYTRYRCSNDQGVCVGQVTRSANLVLERESKHTTLEGSAISGEFDISPNGKYVAYSNHNRICVASSKSQTQCTSAASVGGLSVSDAGEVLFTGGTGQNCVYKDSWHFRPEPLSNNSVHLDECLAIMLWKSGLKSSTRVAALGRQPEWVPQKWALALKHWLMDVGPGFPY